MIKKIVVPVVVAVVATVVAGVILGLGKFFRTVKHWAQQRPSRRKECLMQTGKGGGRIRIRPEGEMAFIECGRVVSGYLESFRVERFIEDLLRDKLVGEERTQNEFGDEVRTGAYYLTTRGHKKAKKLKRREWLKKVVRGVFGFVLPPEDLQPF